MGSAALLALAGCSHNEPPAKQAMSSPTFESNIGSNPGYDSTQGTQSQPGAGAAGQSSAGSPSTPSMTGQEGQGAQGQAGQTTTDTGVGAEATPTVSERDLCDSLTRDAQVHVEDVPGGAAINIKPHTSADLPLLQQRAQQVEARLGQGQSAGQSNASCDLFTIARSGANASVSETPTAVRILITTTDPSQVASIRRQMRNFVSISTKSQGGGKKSGSKGGAQ